MPSVTQTTILLRRMGDGDEDAAQELLPIVYDELHRLAGRLMAGQPVGHTLQPTALVHEAYMKLAGQPGGQQDRRHFIAVAASAMRSVLVDHARAKGAAKRGGGRDRLPIDDALALYEDRALDLLTLDDALSRLAQMDPQLARIVELRFFGGLTAQEAADVEDVSLRTVERGWATARTWLRAALDD